MFPLFLNLTGKLVLIVGGGAVGCRKAKTFLDANARIRMVSLQPPPVPFPFPTEAGSFVWLTEPYCSEHLTGVCLAVAAATPEVNPWVIADARARGIWVNAVDDPGSGDFTLPATHSHGDFQIAVSTAGASPWLAKRVRDQLAEEFDAAYEVWTRLLAEIRPEVLARIADPKVRSEVFRLLSEPSWLDSIRLADLDRVRAQFREVVERHTQP